MWRRVVILVAAAACVAVASSPPALARRAGGPAGEDDPATSPPGAYPPLGPEGTIPRGLDRPIDAETYILGPGDQLVLIVRASEQREFRLAVLPEGSIILPNLGPRRAAGITLAQLRAEVARDLGRYYRGVDIFVQLVTPRRFVVYVLGEVTTPGPVELGAPFRLDAAIAGAGGISDRGSHRSVEIRTDDGVERTADLDRFRRLGDLDQNPMLHEGQIVYVPSRGPHCTVVGEVWRTGPLEVLEGETVREFIVMAGGFTPNAARNRVALERLGEDEALSVATLTEAQLDTAVVRGRDFIVVPDRRTFPGSDFVWVEGGHGREGKILISEGETIGAFVPRFIRLQEDHDLAKAVVERKGEDGEVEFIPVNLRKIIDGEAPGALPLSRGDVISIPVLDRVVYVTGEVSVPGQVAFQRGLPAGRYIALAGGPSKDGSIDRLEIFDTGGDRRGGNRDSLVYRGETILVKRRKAVVFGGFFVGFASLTSLILAAIAVSR